MRLPAALLLAWFACLAGAAPALACAAGQADCCPDRGSEPCGDGTPAGPARTAKACCAVAPAPSVALTGSFARATPADSMDPESPDHAPPGLPAAAASRAVARHPPSFRLSRAPPRDASLTYLHTLRIRL